MGAEEVGLLPGKLVQRSSGLALRFGVAVDALAHLVVGAGAQRRPVGDARLAAVEHLAEGSAVKYANLWSADDVVHDVHIVVIGVVEGGLELSLFERDRFSAR